MIEDDPDIDLLARIGQGDQRAASQMVASKLPRLVALATRMLNDSSEAQDVAQETFVRIWKQAGHWQPDGARFDTWVHRVAMNLCYDRLRRRPNWTEEDIPEQQDPHGHADARLIKIQQDKQVLDALAALPPRQREALILQYYQEFSNAEAAAMMDISVDALESLLCRARRSLRNVLIEQGYTKESP